MVDVMTQYASLYVSASETLDVLLDEFDRHADGVSEFETLASLVNDQFSELYVSPIVAMIPGDAFDDVPEVMVPLASLGTTAGFPSEVWNVLIGYGYAKRAERVFSEVNSDHYTDAARIVSAYEIALPFVAYKVERNWHGNGPKWRIAESLTIPAGIYVVAETVYGYFPSVYGAAYSDPELYNAFPTIEMLADLDDFWCGTIDAYCDACHRVWQAESGSWEFRPSGWSNPQWVDVDWRNPEFGPFNFDDTTGHGEVKPNTTDCPIADCAGRVSYTAR